ncbi:MFS transporter [Calidithermus roseus]|uniref:Putative bacilysin exporter BacE n=1 Tax=Calidithermus roseus TaxID=1644118 RepID=A0A399EYI7_9DEIN|nr:MFS transporter [Calidithermus roseus]RIH89624.1 putative bacilysin exporter BacE [Calidithermus roseus]
MQGVLQLPHFRRLFLAALVSQAGSRMHRVALLAFIYLLTSNTLWVSLALIVKLLASAVVGPLLAPWADTQNRKQLMVLSDVGRAFLTLLIPFLGVNSLPVLLLLVFGIEVLSKIFDPAAQAAIPELVPESKLDSANSLMIFAARISEVVFVGVAGVLVAAVGAQLVFLLDSLTYLISAMILRRLPDLSGGGGGQSYWRRAKEGLEHLLKNLAIRRTVTTLFTAACFGSVEGVLGIVMAVKVLKVGTPGFGAMESALAVGAVLGTLIVPRIAMRLRREQMFFGGLIIFGLFEASLGVWPVFAWVLAALFLSGVFNQVFLVPARSILQSHTPGPLRGRIFAAFFAIMDTAVICGALLAGLLEPVLGAPTVFLLAGLMVSGVSALMLLTGGIPVPKPQPSPQSHL